MSQNKNPEKPADPKQSTRRVKIEDFKVSDSESANVTGGRAMIDDGDAVNIRSARG